MEFITFLVLEDNMKFSERVVALIKRDLTKEMAIECKVMTADNVAKALIVNERLKTDVHVIDIDLVGPKNGFDYLAEVSKEYGEDMPVLPVVIISSFGEDAFKLRALDRFRVIAFIDKSKFLEPATMQSFKRAVSMVKLISVDTVTFSRPGEQRTYKERNVWTITRLPNRSKKMEVTIFDEASGEVVREVFSLKKSLLEIPTLFSNPKVMVRCHKQYLINPRIIIGQHGDKLLLPLGITVPIGAEFADDIAY